MPKRQITEKQRTILEHGRAVRAANLEAKRKAAKSRERTLDLSVGDRSGDSSSPVKPPAKKRQRTAPAPATTTATTEEAPRRGGFLGGLVDAIRS